MSVLKYSIVLILITHTFAFSSITVKVNGEDTTKYVVNGGSVSASGTVATVGHNAGLYIAE